MKPALHHATTAATRALMPFACEGGLPPYGVRIGPDLHGGEFFADPWEWYRAGIVNDLGWVVMALKGHGKTSWLMAWIWRQAALGRWARVLDPKGEYFALLEAWDRAEEEAGTHRYASRIKLAPNGITFVNPLDPRISREDRQTLLVSIAAALLGRPLEPEEGKACEIALDALARRREPTLPALVEAMIFPGEDDARAKGMTLEVLALAGRKPAFALDTLVSGPLRGMFDRPTSPTVDLAAPIVDLDLSAVYRSKALGVLMLVADTFLQSSPPAGEGIYVADEAWAILSDVGIAKGLSADWKFDRMTGVQHVLALHGLQTLRSVGAGGSHQVELAKTLLADSSVRVVGRTDSTQVDLTRQVLGLTRREAHELPHLQTGKWLLKVAGRSFLVEHVLTTHERAFIDPTLAESLRVR